MVEEDGVDGGLNIHEATTSNGLVEEKKSSGKNEDQQRSEDGKAPEKVPFHKLFSFADNFDIVLMILGTVGAIGNGLCMPLMTVVLGEMIDSFGSNQNRKDVVDVVSKVKLHCPSLIL